MRLIEFSLSKRPDKRFVAVFQEPERTIHFGSPKKQTYVDHGKKNIREEHLIRRRVCEDYFRLDEETLTSGVLWGPYRSVEGNLAHLLYLFNVEDHR